MADTAPAHSSPLKLTRMEALRRAWPLVFANASVPLAGVVDTFVLGASGDEVDLAGVALGGALLSIFYWSFYFLRMGTTGLTAQADGADRLEDVQRILLRAAALGLAIGAAFMIARDGLAWIGFAVLQGEAAVEAKGEIYFSIRSFGIPASFLAFAVTGWLIGLGRSGSTFIIYGVFSAVNIVLDLWFVLGLGYGPGGVAAATAIAEWTAGLVAIGFAWRALRAQGGLLESAREKKALLDPHALREMFDINFNLMVRTWTLVIGFTWFANAGAKQGAAALAGNHVLLQVITLWAFVLDAFAFVSETEAGRAVGRRSMDHMRRVLRVTGEPMLASGAVFALLTFAAGPAALSALIADPEARAAAIAFLPYCALVPLLGAPAWLLDGVFIGATSGKILRNAGIAAVIVYLAADLAFGRFADWGNHGVWAAFLIFYLARAGALATAWPALERRLN